MIASHPEVLTHSLAEAASLGDPTLITHRMKTLLEERVASGALRLPKEVRQPHPDHYARRLLYRDPDFGFIVVAMTWGPGQGTQLHDHDGLWVVECVVEGEMEIEVYDPVGPIDADLVRFKQSAKLRSPVGEGGALVPPGEYHVMRNARTSESSITVHVYGGALERCSVFVPLEGDLYRRQDRQLTYDDDLTQLFDLSAETAS